MYKWTVVLIAATCAVAVACGGKRSSSDDVSSLAVEFLPIADGATRLLVSPVGDYAVAEMSDRRVRLFEIADNVVVADESGWMLGSPTDEGDALMVTAALDRVQWMVSDQAVELSPPVGTWKLVGSAVDHKWNTAYVVLDRTDAEPGPRQWVVVLDTLEMTVTATTMLDHGSGLNSRITDKYDSYQACAVAGGMTGVFVACRVLGRRKQKAETWRVTALDDSAKTTWVVELYVVGSAVGRMRMALTGDASHVVLVYGDVRSSGILQMSSVVSLDVKTGAVHQVPTRLWLDNQVRDVSPVPDANEVALLHLHRVSAHGYGDDAFSGVSIIDATSLKATHKYDVNRSTLGGAYENTKELWPEALAVRLDRTVILASRTP